MSPKTAITPSLDIIYDLEYGVWKATALNTALELDIFTIIANEHHTLTAITADVGCDERGMHILLDAICALKLLRKLKGEYFLTPVSEIFLVKGKPAYYGDWCLHTQLAFSTRSRVADGIRAGTIIGIDASQSGTGNLWKSDTSRALYTWPLEAIQARQMWRILGINRHTRPSPRILDVACGTGVSSFVLAQTNPNIKVTAFDFPNVLEATRLVAEAMGVVGQTDFQQGDILTSDFGNGCFDIVLLGKILYYFDTDHVADILHRVYSTLKINGLVIISTYIGDDQSSRNQLAAMIALQLFIFAPQSHVYTFSEYRNLLKKAGFSGVSRRTETLITAIK